MSGHWRSRAACRGMDGEIFFPTAESGPSYEAQVAVAKAICARCPVRAECLAEAIARIPYGIAGGRTPEERRGTRRPITAARTTEVVEAGLRPNAGRDERAAAGRVLIRAGRPVDEVARRCCVTERTATRWAARVRAEALAAEGCPGGSRTRVPITPTQRDRIPERTDRT